LKNGMMLLPLSLTSPLPPPALTALTD
jgi:hypothetical protein